MKKIHIKYQKWIVGMIWCLSLSGVILAFFSLPPVISVPLAIVGVFFPWACSRLIYRVPALLITPATSFETFHNRLGIGLFLSDHKGDKNTPGVSLVYENKYAAKEAFSVIRAWNYGRFIDDQKNIHLSFVREGNGKYMFFIYPGVRDQSSSFVKQTVSDSHKGKEISPEVTTLLLWTSTPIDCSNNKEKEELIESIPHKSHFLLNTVYTTKDGIKQYAKRMFELNSVSVANRSDLPENSIEYHNQWFDGNESDPIAAEKCKAIQEKLRPNKSELSTPFAPSSLTPR